MELQRFRRFLGKNVRKIREESGDSQDALAESSGLNRSYIGSVERSEHNIGIDNIYKIAKGLNVPVSRLFEQDDTKANKKNPGPEKTPVIHKAVIRKNQFRTLLEQCYQHTPRPDLVIIYLERCGVQFIE